MATITTLACGPQATNQGNTGQTLTITGTSLTGATVVRIGSRSVTPLTVSATQVTCVVPGGCGVQNVTVTATSGTSNALPFFYIPTPVLSGVSPVEGQAVSPGPVTFTGSDLLTTNQISFNGTPTTNPITVNSDASVTTTPLAFTPVGASPWFQTVSTAVRTAGGSVSLPSALIAYDTPTVANLSPNTGPANTTTDLVITGTAFVSGSIQVTFGTTPADFTTLSDIQISATAPALPAGSVNVVVSTPGGSSTPVTFTYV